MSELTSSGEFGDYLVFVDESGDHGLKHYGPEYPVFVLLFVIVKKDEDVAHVCPEVQRFKLDFWGHDAVVLHETDFRKPGVRSSSSSTRIRAIGSWSGLIRSSQDYP